MIKNGYVNGSDLLIKIKEKAFGHCTTHTTTFNSDTKERAVKAAFDQPSSVALFKEKGVTGLSVSISAEGLVYKGEAESGIKDLRKLWKAGDLVEVEAYEREAEKPYLKGTFVIASLEETAPAQTIPPTASHSKTQAWCTSTTK